MWTFLPLRGWFQLICLQLWYKRLWDRHTHTSAFNFTVPLGYLFQPPGDPGFVIIPRNFNAPVKRQISSVKFSQSPNSSTPQNSSICRMVSSNHLTHHHVLSPSFQLSTVYFHKTWTYILSKPALRQNGHTEISSSLGLISSCFSFFTTSLSAWPPCSSCPILLGLLRAAERRCERL